MKVLTQAQIRQIYGSTKGLNWLGTGSFGFHNTLKNYSSFYNTFYNSYYSSNKDNPVSLSRELPTFSNLGKYNRGVYLTETTTNLIYNSHFSSGYTFATPSGWTLSTSGTTLGTAFITRDEIGGNALTTNVIKVTKGSSTGYTFIVSSGMTCTTGTTYTASIYAKTLTSGASLQIRNNSGGVEGSIAIPTGLTWSRVILSVSLTGSTPHTLYVGYATNEGYQGNSIYFHAPQLENLSNASPFNVYNSLSVRYGTYIDYAATGNIDMSQGSISFWYTPLFKYDSLGDRYLFNLYTDATNYWEIYYSFGGVFSFNECSGGTSTTLTSTTVSFNCADNVHIACTWSGVTTSFYINGVFCSSGTTRTITLPRYFRIGADNSGLKNSNGVISDFSIFNKQLSSTEVLSIYNSLKPLGE